MRNRAFVIGSYTPGDVNVERFMTTVSELNYNIEPPADLGRAMRKLGRATKWASDDRDIVLFCVNAGLNNIPNILTSLRSPNRRTIIYAHPRRASPQAAVQYCHDGLADDYLVWGEEVTGDRIEEHVKALHENRSPYRKIDVGLSSSKGQNARVFIATPFDRENRMVMSDAVDPVMTRVKLTPCWADTFYRNTSVPQQVLDEIDNSSLLIANISASPNSTHNPNVYYEAGYAKARDIPVIFVRPLKEKHLIVPADISERRRIEYDNPIDLSMRLYGGLREEK
jgi:hypothetical protein